MAETTDVFISSTSEDLKDYRAIATHVIQRLGMRPIGMEDFPASPDDAITLCKAKVDEAEVYLGIYAHRYGWQPFGEKSITEMEYDWAIENKLPPYIFMIDEDYSWPPKLIDKGKAYELLEAFKKKIKNTHVVKFFGDKDKFKEDLFFTLKDVRPTTTSLHPPQFDMPKLPAPYIAHRYSLLGERGLIGRQTELRWLTDWIVKKDSPLYGATMMHVVAIGGMGKSALTWKWFTEIAPQDMTPLAGRVWWSFYESDAHFENFIIRTLAYVSQTHTDEIKKLKPAQREQKLLDILNREPFLIVMDGLERILNAYARMDAAYLQDDDLDKKTANTVAGALGLPESAAESFTGQHRLRKTVDPRAGQFLRKLCGVKSSKVLVSTRLYPVDLQLMTGNPMAGNAAIFLTGLSDDDALELWRATGATGSREILQPLLKSFDNYPLLIRALAGEVNRFRGGPGDFDAWRAKNPTFNPASLPLADRKSHVLKHALTELGDQNRNVLRPLAAFRSPATYDALLSILVTDDFSENDLDNALNELEDRGLVGWDRGVNRYDLHPITRGVVWGNVGEADKQGIYANTESYFRSVPLKENWRDVESLEDLTPAIELYQALVGQGNYDDAGRFFYQRLSDPMLYRLSANRQRIELLEALFPDGLDQLPRRERPDGQAYVLNALALAYQNSGQVGRAVPLYRRKNKEIDEPRGDMKSVAVGLSNLADAARLSGQIKIAIESADQALTITRELGDRFQEGISLQWLGLAEAARGAWDAAETHLQASLAIFQELHEQQSAGLVNAFLAQVALWHGDAASAAPLADRAWQLAGVHHLEADFILAARLQGAAALALGNLETADERLHHALTRAKAVNYVQEELPALVGLASLARQWGNLALAREHLDDIWEFAEAGPFPLFHADAFNELARVELAAGNPSEARAAVQQALKYAACDGGEYTYKRGMLDAEAIRREIDEA